MRNLMIQEKSNFSWHSIKHWANVIDGLSLGILGWEIMNCSCFGAIRENFWKVHGRVHRWETENDKGKGPMQTRVMPKMTTNGESASAGCSSAECKLQRGSPRKF
jgi:hypothetical protein